MKNIVAIVVTYNPSSNVQDLICSLANQVETVIVVDNASLHFDFQENTLPESVELIKLQSNLGIAAAQNIGIKKGLEMKADYFVFFDQDSQIKNNMIANLCQSYIDLSSKVKLAAVGPIFYDPDYNFTYPQIKLKPFIGRERIIAENDDKPIEVSFIISSGTFTSADVINNVGIMNEDLFIDYVDTEWCLRAGDKKYKFYALPKVKMIHTIGDDKIKFLIWNLPVHSPWRRYFRMRNMYVLFSLKYVPVSMKLREFFINNLHQLLIVLSRTNKLEYIRYWYSSQIDGIRYLFTKKI